MSRAPLVNGRVVASYGRHYLVETGERSVLSCFVRGKKSAIACGDRVAVLPAGEGQGVIEAVDPRSSLFLRAAAHRRKAIAANIMQVAIVVATDPSFSDELVARVLAAAEQQNLKSCIILNKTDLPAGSARERLEPLARAGYRIIELSALRDVRPVLAFLAGQTTLLVGQSGMGKSTLLNSLIPDAGARTRETSAFLASGRHTTTAVRLYRLEDGSEIIDCPGLQEFGLAHLDSHDIANGFIEFRPFAAQCRFPDCRHRGEPGCAVAGAVASGLIHPRRLELFRRIARAETRL